MMITFSELQTLATSLRDAGSLICQGQNALTINTPGVFKWLLLLTVVKHSSATSESIVV